jgi:hypothetical protein
MWPFKKKQQQTQTASQARAVLATNEPTLKTNVTAFWEWFTANAERFYDTIETKKCADLTDEFSEAVDRWLPGMGWVFGPGENKIGHSFTLTGEGVLTRQFVAEYWLTQAPKLPNWTFYASRQPSDHVESFSIKIDGQAFRAQELWIAAYVDDQNESIDIMAWHPLFAQMENEARLGVLFLLLDEVLGEHGTGTWLGEIEIGDSRLKEAFPIREMREFVTRVGIDKGWKKGNPTQGFSAYSMEEQAEGYPRADIYSGGTRCMSLVNEYAESQGKGLEHPLKNSGVELVFVCFNSACLPKDGEVDFRYHLSDDIAAALELGHLGEALGGAFGTDWAYIDLMLYDGQRSLDTVLEVLRQRELPDDTHVRWFTNDRAGLVVRV